VDTYRSTIRWVVVAFAAIAALMAGTAPLTGLGDVNDDRVWMVAVGAGAGVLGALAAVLAAVRVLQPVAVYPAMVKAAKRNWFKRTWVGSSRIEDELARRPEQYLPVGIITMDDLADGIANLRASCAQLAEAVGAAPDQDRRAHAQQALDDARDVLAQYRVARRQILGLARFERARTMFNRMLVIMSAGALVAAIGIASTLYGINTTEDESVTARSATPRTVTVILTSEGASSLAASLGASCVKSPVAATLLGGDETAGPWDILVTDTDECSLTRLVLTPVLGTIS